MDGKVDYKKLNKELYQPGTAPGIVDVPPMLFLCHDGHGNPNEEGGAYQKALEALYAVTYTIKMSKMSGKAPRGYFEYSVPPLEGLWWLSNDADTDFFSSKERYHWTALIRQPEFVTDEVLLWAKEEAKRKKPEVDTSGVRLITFTEGLCVQALHIGPFDHEPETLAKLEAFIHVNNLITDIGAELPGGMRRRHHEIYMGNPRKTKPEGMKTVLRHPVRRG